MPSHPERFSARATSNLIIQLDNKGTRAQSAGMRRLLGSGFLTHPTHLLAAAIAAGALLGQPGRADAFVEDLCYAKGGGAITNCTPLPEVCRPAGNDSVVCK